MADVLQYSKTYEKGEKEKMRRIIALLLSVLVCLSFCACGSKTTQEGKNENQTTNVENEEKLTDEEITDILLSDVWYSVPTNRENGYQFVGGGVCYLKIKGASQDFSSEWKISDGYVIVSVEVMGQVQKNPMQLKKVDGIYRLQSELDKEGEAYLVRDQDFEAAVETAGIEFTEPLPEAVTETAHCTLEGVYLDNSYVDKDNSSLKLVYVCYSVQTQDQNLRVSSKLSELSFDSGNTYESSHYPNSGTDDMPNYYSSDYIEDVYVGQSLKMVSVFKVPEGEFKTGVFFSVHPYGIPAEEKLVINTDDVKYFDSVEELAQTADPDGYAEMLRRHEPADQQTVSRVKAEINGYYWSFYVNSISYQIEFFAPNRFEVRVRSLNVKNGGTYEVQNGFVVCTYDSNGSSVEIPYTFGENGIDLDVTDAFDVRN